MGKIIQQDDHIIIPRATLSRFIDDKQLFSSLDLSDSSDINIKKHRPKTFHVQKGYYDVSIDQKIKKIETEIGMWNKKLSETTQENINDIDFEDLKEFSIRLITLQFHRCVMADSSFREKFIKIKQKEYSGISLNGFLSGEINKEFLDRKLKFDKSVKDENSFIRYFQENFLLQPNDNIESTYKNFKAVVLHIPDEVESTFILPPTHFVGIDNTARIILNPKLAIGLYPKEYKINNLHILSEDEVDALVARSIEVTLEFSNEYREIIGGESYLNILKKKIIEFNNSIVKEPNEDVIFLSKIKDFCIDDKNILDIIMFIKYLQPNINNIIIDSRVLPSIETDYLSWVSLFQKYGYKIAFLRSNNILSGLENISFNNKDNAINYLLSLQRTVYPMRHFYVPKARIFVPAFF